MRLIILGVGGWISKPILGHTSVLVEEEGWRILLDAGEGSARALYLHGGGLSGLKAIVVTHLHGDHVLGLPTVLMLLKHTGTGRIKVFVPAEARGDLEELLRITGVDYEGIADTIGVVHGEEHDIEIFKLRFIRALHVIPSLSVRLDAKDRCIVYSGDTSYNPNLVELARGCDVLIHEASGYDPIAHLHGHSTVADALRVAEEAGVKRAVLVHYYLDIPCIKPEEVKTKVVYSLAYPGYELEL